MKTTLTSIGNDIKTYRLEAGLSQEQLAVLSNVERSQLSRIESGEVYGVTYATIEKILNSLGRTIQHVKIEERERKLYIHPFVKWAGGKTQLLHAIENHLPKTFNRYFEPFVGGGALLFKIQPKSFNINDSNAELICAYECFKSDALFKALKDNLIEHETKHCEEYFYKVREEDRNPLFFALPKEYRASRLIYLNKACFNGLYRVNSKGYFNVPFGKKDKVNCFDRNNFEFLHQFFKTHEGIITNCDFEEAVKDAKAGDFVYFDPPYDSWDEKNSFTSYDKNMFGKEEQKRLAKVFNELHLKGVFVMLSNHNTPLIRQLYSNFTIHVIPAKRIINSKASGRGFVEEVLITNYE